MALGQASGPPATGKQIRELLELLEAAGHSGFRDARGPMGFTQRQAGGKFTNGEAQAFIDQLEQEAYEQDTSPSPPPPPTPRVTAKPMPSPAPRVAATPVSPVRSHAVAVRPDALAAASDEALLAEVRRRGLTL